MAKIKKEIILLCCCFLLWVSGCSYGERQMEELGQAFARHKDPEGWRLVSRAESWEYDNEYQIYNRDYELGYENALALSGDSLDSFKSYDPYRGRVNKNEHMEIVYIGAWRYDESLGQDIRLILEQKLDNGRVVATYETKDERNQNIPAKPLKLIAEPHDFGGTVVAMARFDQEGL